VTGKVASPWLSWIISANAQGITLGRVRHGPAGLHRRRGCGRRARTSTMKSEMMAIDARNAG